MRHEGIALRGCLPTGRRGARPFCPARATRPGCWRTPRRPAPVWPPLAVAQERVNYTPVAQERVHCLYADVGGIKIRLPHCPKAAVAGVLAIFIVVATVLVELMFGG